MCKNVIMLLIDQSTINRNFMWISLIDLVAQKVHLFNIIKNTRKAFIQKPTFAFNLHKYSLLFENVILNLLFSLRLIVLEMSSSSLIPIVDVVSMTAELVLLAANSAFLRLSGARFLNSRLACCLSLWINKLSLVIDGDGGVSLLWCRSKCL